MVIGVLVMPVEREAGAHAAKELAFSGVQLDVGGTEVALRAHVHSEIGPIDCRHAPPATEAKAVIDDLRQCRVVHANPPAGTILKSCCAPKRAFSAKATKDPMLRVSEKYDARSSRDQDGKSCPHDATRPRITRQHDTEDHNAWQRAPSEHQRRGPKAIYR
jgi:hypothetical protein